MNKKSVNSQKIVIVTGIENCENNALSIRSFKKLGDFSPSCVRIAFFGKYIDDVKETQCVWSHVLRKYTLEDDQNSPRYTKKRFGAPLLYFTSSLANAARDDSGGQYI